MKSRTEEIEQYLEEYWAHFYRSLKSDINIKNYLGSAIKDFGKYDQGSLSFTITAMRHVGYDYPYAIMEAIDSTK
jgi:hypothetical protein